MSNNDNDLSNFFERLFSAMVQGAKRLETIDLEDKEVGDRVIITDMQHMPYVHTYPEGKCVVEKGQDEPTDGQMILFAQIFIVAHIDKEFIYKCHWCEKDHKSDTVIYLPSDKSMYWIDRQHIRVVEQDEL